MGLTMRRVVGALLVVVALTVVVWALYYTFQNTVATTSTMTTTITSTIVTTSQAVSFNGNSRWALFAAGLTIMVAGVAGVFLLTEKPEPLHAESDTTGKQSTA